MADDMNPIPWNSTRHGISQNAPLQRLVRKRTVKRPFNPTQTKYIKKLAKRALVTQEEKKYIDTSILYTQIDRIGLGPTSLCDINQGPAQGQRVGDRVRGSALRGKIQIYYNSGVTSAQHTARVIVFKWHISDTVLVPLSSHILQNIGGVGDYRITSTDYNWQGQKQRDYTILYDKSFSIGAYGSGVAENIWIPLKGSPVQYDQAANTGEGKYFILIVGDDVTGAHTPNIYGQYYFRFVYTDA